MPRNVRSSNCSIVSPDLEVGLGDRLPEISRFCGVIVFAPEDDIRIRGPSPFGEGGDVVAGDGFGGGEFGIFVMPKGGCSPSRFP